MNMSVHVDQFMLIFYIIAPGQATTAHETGGVTGAYGGEAGATAAQKTWVQKTEAGLFGVGQFAVKKKTEPNLTEKKNLTAKCPKAKNPAMIGNYCSENVSVGYFLYCPYTLVVGSGTKPIWWSAFHSAMCRNYFKFKYLVYISHMNICI